MIDFGKILIDIPDEYREDLIKENEEFYSILNSASNNLSFFCLKLEEILKKDILNKPWYKNITEIYIDQANEYYKKCKIKDFDFIESDNMWMRRDFNNYVTNIEKFIKFFINESLSIKGLKFSQAIELLSSVVKKFKVQFNNILPNWPSWIDIIKCNLHWYRKVQNKNKHEEDHMDSNYFDDLKNKFLISIDSDVLSIVSKTLENIINFLLCSLIAIKSDFKIVLFDRLNIKELN